MKKIIIAILFSLSVIVSTNVYAAWVDYTYTDHIQDDFDTWSIYYDESDVPIMKSNRVYFTGDRISSLTIGPTWYGANQGEITYSEHMIVQNRLNTYSRIEVFDNVTDTLPVLSYNFYHEDSNDEYSMMYSEAFSQAVRDGLVQNKYIRFVLVLDAIDDSLLDRFVDYWSIEEIYNQDIFFEVWFTLDPFDVTNFDEVSSLPNTTGDLQTPGIYGAVNYQVTDNSVHFIINYNNVDYHILKSFTDVSVFEYENHAYYYIDHETGNHMIYIDYGSQNVPFLLDDTSTVSEWRPFTLFNLDTNEYYYTGDVHVVSNVQTENEDEIYLYFYLDQINYDDIEAVDINFSYNYVKNETWLHGEEISDLYSTSVNLQRGDTSVVNHTPTWVKTAYYSSIGAAALGGLLSAIPGTQLIGASIFLTGMISSYAFNQLQGSAFFDLELEDIARFYPTSEQYNQLLSNYKVATNDDNFELPSIAKLYKMFLGEYDLGNYDRIQVVSNGLNITRLVYSQNGSLVEVTSPWIYQDITGDDEVPIIPYEPDTPTSPNSFNIALFVIGAAIVFVVVIGVAVSQKKGSKAYAREYSKPYRRL
ncbi:MAG: hypothetical protein AB7E61_06075 [Acholeplasmataceae bacterium]